MAMLICKRNNAYYSSRMRNTCNVLLFIMARLINDYFPVKLCFDKVPWVVLGVGVLEGAALNF